MQSARYFCPILTKFGFSKTYFNRSPKYQISQKMLPVGAALVHADRRTDAHDEANKHFSQLCGRFYLKKDAVGKASALSDVVHGITLLVLHGRT
jgi:hypothetical protein